MTVNTPSVGASGGASGSAASIGGATLPSPVTPIDASRLAPVEQLPATAGPAQK
jgi:hypothetical protein